MKKNLSGFTLIEIIITIIIIGAIAGAALPRFTGTVERVKVAEGKQILLSLLNAQKVYYLENSQYATDIDDLDIEILTSPNFDITTIGVNNDPDKVATINRIGETYTLFIKSDGSFDCDGSGCTQIGM